MGLSNEESGSTAGRAKGLSLLQNVQTASADLLQGIRGAGREAQHSLSTLGFTGTKLPLLYTPSLRA